MNARWIRMAAKPFEASCASLAAAQHGRSAPVLAWAQDETEYRYALIAPRVRAPGKESRWLSWGLSAAVATYRQFGYPAYLDKGISLYGRRIAEASVRSVGECVLVASCFLRHFPAAVIATPSAMLEQAFRLRLEAQHGWQFDHSWPTALEEPSPASATAA
jgi:hypothetical protein